MNRIITTIVLTMACAGLTTAAPVSLTKSGTCKLSAESNTDVIVTLTNRDLRVECHFEGGTAFGRFRLSAVPFITNLAGKPLSLSYNVAFYDKDKQLLGCTSQFDPDIRAKAEGYQLSSAQTVISKEFFDRIASYECVIYYEINEAK